MSLPFSIIMPIYNGSEYLEETLKSISNQTFDNFEIIAVSDGSSDDTIDILRDYASTDNRIIVIDRKYNIGVYDSITQGCQISRGRYILPSSCDDLFREDKLEEFYTHFESDKNIGVIGSHVQKFGKSNEVIKFLQTHNENKYISMPFGMMGSGIPAIRRDVFQKCKFSKDYGYAGDYDFLAQVLLKTNYKIQTIPKPLTKFRVHDTGLSNKLDYKNPNLIGLKVLSYSYKIEIHPAITYALNNLNTLTRGKLNTAKLAINKTASLLDKHYSKKMNISLSSMLNKQFSFLLQAS